MNEADGDDSQSDTKAQAVSPISTAGGDWVDANHMFFFMTALSCKLTCDGIGEFAVHLLRCQDNTDHFVTGRQYPTADLYKKAMEEKVPFQYYKDWIMRGKRAEAYDEVGL